MAPIVWCPQGILAPRPVGGKAVKLASSSPPAGRRPPKAAPAAGRRPEGLFQPGALLPPPPAVPPPGRAFRLGRPELSPAGVVPGRAFLGRGSKEVVLRKQLVDAVDAERVVHEPARRIEQIVVVKEAPPLPPLPLLRGASGVGDPPLQASPPRVVPVLVQLPPRRGPAGCGPDGGRPDGGRPGGGAFAGRLFALCRFGRKLFPVGKHSLQLF